MQDWMGDQERFFRHQDKIEKKVAAMEKKMSLALQANKDKRQQHLDSQHLRKADEEHQQRQRARRIMERFESSGKAVEDFMREQAHELALKQELRKLREEDMRKQSDRQKRLQLIHKLKVLEGEKTAHTRVQSVRDRENALISMRM